MTTEQALLKRYKHDYWGTISDKWYSKSSLHEVVEEQIEAELDEIGTDDKSCVFLSFTACGGDACGHHISHTFSDWVDVRELLDDYRDSACSTKEYFCNIADLIEERYAECIMEINTSECDMYVMPNKLAKSLRRIFHREAKQYEAKFYDGDEAAMRRIANTLLRRYQRAIRHLPVQRWGRLFNCHEYVLTIKSGEINNIERIDREEHSEE